MSDIEQQVQTLQEQIRRQRRWNFTLIGVALIGGLLAATASDDVPDVIKARKFELVGSSGAPLAEMKIGTMQGEEFGTITTFNAQNGPLIRMSAATGGAGWIATLNGKGAELVEISQDKSGSGWIATRNDEGAKLVEISQNNGGGSLLTKTGKGGRLVFLTSTDRGDSGGLVTYNSEEQHMVALTTMDDGKAGKIKTLNHKGKQTSSMP